MQNRIAVVGTERITIGGRHFKYAGDVTTLRHDLATQAQLQRAGLSRLELLPAETPDDYALRIFRIAVGNGDMLSLIAHLLLPEELDPRKWTPEVAAEMAAFLGAMTDPEDKIRIQAILRDALVGFLQAGLVYAVRSLNASVQDEDALSHDQTTA